jgi:hypothetical protein
MDQTMPSPLTEKILSSIPTPEDEAETLLQKTNAMLTFASKDAEIYWRVTAGADCISVVDSLRSTPGFMFRLKAETSQMSPEDLGEAFKVIMEWLDERIPISVGWKFKLSNIDFPCERKS